jgi:hypothetical protein
MNGTYAILAYTDDINLLGVNIKVKKNTETLLDTSKEAGIEINYVHVYLRSSIRRTTLLYKSS